MTVDLRGSLGAAGHVGWPHARCCLLSRSALAHQAQPRPKVRDWLAWGCLQPRHCTGTGH
jgi:hypothetical protein